MQAISLGPRRAPLTAMNLALLAIRLSPMILVHVGTVAVLFIEQTWQDWLVLPFMLYYRGFFVAVGYHRYFSHRSFKTSRFVQFLIAVGCCTNMQQGPLWWAVHHRHHHRHSDESGDPHSPIQGGILWAWFGWLFIPLDPVWKGVSDLRRFPELVWLERFWQVPGLLMAGVFYLVGGWSALLIGFCLSAVIVFQMTFAVNTIAHLVGTQRYRTGDRSRNSFLLAILTMGEGWHNNHHHYPNAAQAGFFWWEIDGAYRAILLLERLGIIWGVHRVPKHKLLPSSANRVQLEAKGPAAFDPASVTS